LFQKYFCRFFEKKENLTKTTDQKISATQGKKGKKGKKRHFQHRERDRFIHHNHYLY